MTKQIAMGIDLGTSNSCVAIVEDGVPKVIANKGGYKTTPSMVAVSESGRRLVGHIAKRQAITNAVNTVYAAKRLIGRKWSHPSVQQARQVLPYKLVEGDTGDVRIELREKTYAVPEISAIVLAEMKKVAEDYFGGPVDKAVITIPAYFNDGQRQATKDAGRIAGLDVKRIINEPTAAALAYGLDRRGNKQGLIAVYDLGGGTFDISILELQDGVFEVKATNGDTYLGGEDFDQRIVNWLAEDFQTAHPAIDLRKDKMALQRLREAAEKAKHELSSSQETDINLPFICADATGPKHLVMTMSRSKLEELTEDLIQRSLVPCQQCLTDSGVKKEAITDVLLVGGMTRMPRVQHLVAAFFGREPNKEVNPDEVVAIGAAVQGGVLTGVVKNVLLLDVTPLTLGVETFGAVATPIIERNTTVPAKKSMVFSTAQDNQPMVSVHILQGERPMAADNKTLARFELVGIPPAPRGVPQIEVSFDIDANGIVNVTAKDRATGKEQHITITASSGLSELQIQQMVKDAEANSADDKKRREVVEERNKLDSMIYNIEKMLKDSGDKVAADSKAAVEAAVTDAKTKLDSQDAAVLKTAHEELTKASHKMAEELYKQSADQPNPAAAAEGDAPKADDKKGGDDVVDAEFEESPRN